MLDDYSTVIAYAEQLRHEGWEINDLFAYLREPWNWRQERQQWIDRRRGPKLTKWMTEQADRRRALMDGAPSLTQNDELHLRAARQAQAEKPGEACSLCSAVGMEICDGCTSLGENK